MLNIIIWRSLVISRKFLSEEQAVAQMTSKITIARDALNLHNYLKQLDGQRSRACFFWR